jgi:hypothetical protein
MLDKFGIYKHALTFLCRLEKGAEEFNEDELISCCKEKGVSYLHSNLLSILPLHHYCTNIQIEFRITQYVCLRLAYLDGREG